MLHIIYDDLTAVPEALRSLVGAARFGQLVFRRRTQLEAMRELADAVGVELIHLTETAALEALVARLGEETSEAAYLYCPAHLATVTPPDRLRTFLAQIRYAPTALHIPLAQGERRGWSLMRSRLMAEFLEHRRAETLKTFFEKHGEALVEVRDRVQLINLADERTLADYISGQFDARFYNSIERGDYTVTKRSTDRGKLRREFEFFAQAPPDLQMFFVQPFDFADDGVTASYRMERLAIPDMALQWVHGDLKAHEFERFLRHMFYFLDRRPTRSADRATAARVRRGLYIEKVEQRLAELKAHAAYRSLEPLLDIACGGVDALFARYLQQYQRTERRFADRLALGHGDPCFSNILYAKAEQILKLIDPRGAASAEELFTDPYYDVAKLSHSICGGYDFINHGSFELVVSQDLRLGLRLERDPPAWAAGLFRARLDEAGFDPELVRTCEASLFISMLPLHIDRPRNVLGFAATADAILSELRAPRGAR